MSKLANTLKELQILRNKKIEFAFTRFNNMSKKEPTDLDILIKPKEFKKVIQSLNKVGFKTYSHDAALGGRIAGMQINLVKQECIKIDLHQDFTWRANRYLDLDMIWEGLVERKFSGIKIKMPSGSRDAFLVLINVIFEKTYFTKHDWEKIYKNIDKIFNDGIYEKQAKKYGWLDSFNKFKAWWFKEAVSNHKFPKFLPFWLILYSYLEKFNLTSFAYYLFFRTRYLVSKTLPYE